MKKMSNIVYDLMTALKEVITQETVMEDPINREPEPEKMEGKILYVGAFLHDPDSEEMAKDGPLCKWWEKNIGPLHRMVWAHHITLAYMPDARSDKDLLDLYANDLGAIIDFEVVGYAADEHAQVVCLHQWTGGGEDKDSKTVRTRDPFGRDEAQYREEVRFHGHCTVTTDGKGDAYSERLLREHYIELPLGFRRLVVQGRIGWMVSSKQGTGVIYSR
jgi:hypothetical protein